MAATILNMSRQLLELGQQCIKTGNARKGLRVLNDLLSRDDVAPSVAAEANIGSPRAHYQQSDYPHARERLAAALAEDPQNAEGHRLMGRLNELDVDGSVEAARTHYARAVELPPTIPRPLVSSPGIWRGSSRPTRDCGCCAEPTRSIR